MPEQQSVGFTVSQRIAYGIRLLAVLAAIILAVLAFYAIGFHILWGEWPS